MITKYTLGQKVFLAGYIVMDRPVLEERKVIGIMIKDGEVQYKVEGESLFLNLFSYDFISEKYIHGSEKEARVELMKQIDRFRKIAMSVSVKRLAAKKGGKKSGKSKA